MVVARIGKLLEVALLDAADVDVRVERRARGEGEDLPGVRIHRDDRAPVRRPLPVLEREADAVLQGFLGCALELDVDREPDVVPGLRHLAELAWALDAPERVDEHAADTG